MDSATYFEDYAAAHPYEQSGPGEYDNTWLSRVPLPLWPLAVLLAFTACLAAPVAIAYLVVAAL